MPLQNEIPIWMGFTSYAGPCAEKTGVSSLLESSWDTDPAMRSYLQIKIINISKPFVIVTHFLLLHNYITADHTRTASFQK